MVRKGTSYVHSTGSRAWFHLGDKDSSNYEAQCSEPFLKSQFPPALHGTLLATHVRCELLTQRTMKITAFWEMTPCSVAGKGPCCFQMSTRNVTLHISVTAGIMEPSRSRSLKSF